MKKLIFSLLFCFTASYSIAQQNDHDPFYIYENVGKSPEVSKLGTYGEQGGNAYNGKLNLSIPIHSINWEGLNIPINVSHNSSGLKPAAEAGWVGLNWNISTTYAISRSVNGLDDLRDDAAPFGLQGRIGWVYNPYTVRSGGAGFNYMSYEDIVDIHKSYVPDEGAARQIDTQPDFFEISLFGNSYKFRLEKKDGSRTNRINTKVFNNNNVKIWYDLTDESFTILDEWGFIYKFATKELSTGFSSVPSANNQNNAQPVNSESLKQIFADRTKADEGLVNSWHLDKIISPNGKELKFDYDRGLYIGFPSYSGFTTVQENTTNYHPSGNGLRVNQTNLYNATISIIENVYLQRISGDFGEVIFNSGPREDLMTGFNLKQLSGENTFSLVTRWSVVSNYHGSPTFTNLNDSPYFGKKLESIRVRDYLGNTVMNAAFDYSYFDNPKRTAIDKQRYLRLKLDKIAINEKDFRFTYLQPNQIPAKDTKDTDFWGFYNGAENTDVVPSIGRFVTQEMLTSVGLKYGQTYFEYKGADRGSNFNFGQIGLLTRVDYPTGGYSEFEYEPHQALVQTTKPYTVTERFPELGNRLKWTSLIDESNYNFTYEYLKRAKDPAYTLFGKEAENQSSTITIPIQKNEVFTVDRNSTFLAKGNLRTQTGWENISYYFGHPIRVLENIDDPGLKYDIFKYGDAPTIGSVTNYKELNFIIPPGDYRVIEKTAPWELNNPGIPAVTVQEEIDGNPNTNPYFIETTTSNSGAGLFEQFEIGGARIKSITNRDNNRSFISKKAYVYNYDGHSEASSGVLMDQLIFFSDAYGYNSYDPRGYAESPLKLTSNTALRVNPAAQGSHIGYTSIKELYVDENEIALGWVAKNYHNQPNQYFTDSFCRRYQLTGIGNSGSVCVKNTLILGLDPLFSNAHLNGNTLTEKTYDCSGNVVTSNSFQYSTLTGNNNLDYHASFMPLFVANAASQYNPGETDPWASDHATYYVYSLPQHYGIKSVLKETIGSQILEGKEISSKDTHIYDAYSHHLIEKETFTEPNNVYRTKLLYPYSNDMNGKPFMDKLVAENKLGVVVKTENYLNQDKLGTKVYQYDNSTNTGNRTLVNAVSTSKGEQEDETSMFYEKYDADGTLLQARRKDGSPVTYIWGYNNQHVIAKIENATVELVSEFVEELKQLSNRDNTTCNQTEYCTENSLRRELNFLRNKTSLSNTLITTFTYDPLVGVTSMTNPNGVLSYFEYDEYNRLIAIKDQDNNLIEDYKYHLANKLLPNTSGSTKVSEFICETGGFERGVNQGSVNSNSSINTSIDIESGYKKLNAVLDIAFVSGSGTNTKVSYNVFPYGGSGNYKYRWRQSGEEFSMFSTEKTWGTTVSCKRLNERYSKVECEVLDTVTGYTYLVQYEHPLPCAQ